MGACKISSHVIVFNMSLGFKDLGSFVEDSSNVAHNTFQFMVHGISTKYKQPVGHFFVRNSVDSAVLRPMIVQLIDKLQSCRLVVCALVCDQEASHQGWVVTMYFYYNQDIVENQFRCVLGKGCKDVSLITLEYESLSLMLTVKHLSSIAIELYMLSMKGVDLAAQLLWYKITQQSA